MHKIVYLTFNDAPGGIFTSQVVDVCHFLRKELQADVTLVSFISLRTFFANRKRIHQSYSNAIVLPMWPGIENWQRNRHTLSLHLRILSAHTVIARGPFAALLASKSSAARVCFDARGAYTAEFSEYNVGGGKFSLEEIRAIEQQAVEQCDGAITVSQALVDYWKREFNYNADKHVVIPCTLADHATSIPLAERKDKRIRIVFSGGNGKWQSLHLISDLLIPLFESNPDVDLLMLTAKLPASFPLRERFPERVQQKWVTEEEVPALLASCDYGWLVRENTVTNQVASPVKFAEYLSAGLSVIISEQLGDFTTFVEQHQCGIVVKNNSVPALSLQSQKQKEYNQSLAAAYFHKKKYMNEYQQCL